MAADSYERQQAYLRARYEQLEAAKAERVDKIMNGPQPEIERALDVYAGDDKELREIATKNIAEELANRGISNITLGRDGNIDYRDLIDIVDRSVAEAYAIQRQQWEHQASPQIEPPEQGLDEPPALPVEPNGPTPTEGPGMQAEIAPEDVARDPEARSLNTLADMKREQAGLLAVDPQQAEIAVRADGIMPMDAARGEGLQRPPTDINIDRAGDEPYQVPPLGDPAPWSVSLPDMKQANAEIIGDGPQQEQEAAGRKRLSFFEDRQAEADLERGADRQDRAQAERAQTSSKKLSFFEDRNPSQAHGMDH